MEDLAEPELDDGLAVSVDRDASAPSEPGAAETGGQPSPPATNAKASVEPASTSGGEEAATTGEQPSEHPESAESAPSRDRRAVLRVVTTFGYRVVRPARGRAVRHAADASQADSSQADSSQADSSQADSSQADSSQADSSQADSSQTATAVAAAAPSPPEVPVAGPDSVDAPAAKTTDKTTDKASDKDTEKPAEKPARSHDQSEFLHVLSSASPAAAEAERAADEPEAAEPRRAGLGARARAAVDEVERRRAAARQASQDKSAARAAAQEGETARREASRRRALHEEAMQVEARRRERRRRTIARLVRRDRARKTRRRRILVALMIAPLLAAAGVAVAAYYVDSIPAPAELVLPEATTIYYADGTTPMARLGSENRTIVGYGDMNLAVKQAIVAAEDRTFWSNSGVSLSSVLRAGLNNVTGGDLQGGSTITQQYVRIAAGLKGVTFARKTREAMLAWKMDHSYTKEKILDFYLNTVPFGRGAYGIEAAAQAYFGKTIRASAPQAQQITVSEAMVLASVVKQPEPDQSDPQGHPGYDPARGGTAAANALMRWRYVRDGMVALGYLTSAEAAALEYPHTVRPLDLSVPDNGLDRPTGLVVNHVLSELRQSPPFAGQAPDFIRNGGFRIVTTVDKRAQDAAEAAADIRRVTAPGVDRGQPADWQAALVAVEPGTGRVLAYYGGGSGTGADFAGWYYDADGQARGYGQHPPGSSFKVYDLAEALKQGISLSSHWDSPAVKEFPNSGRTNSSPTGPIRNSSSASCQPNCTLLEATIASLNVPFFDLTEHLGPANVIDMASKAGIDSLWTDPTAQQPSVRVDLRPNVEKVANTQGASVKSFSTEVGIGQYGLTVLDHANGMATFAAGGERAQAHFVRAVYRHDDLVYAEQLTQSPIGLTTAQVDQLTSALSQVPSAKLPNGWDAAGKTGTWQAGNSLTDNADAWMVGYTHALAVAVWLGTSDGKALKTKDGKSDVFGSTHAAPIWQQFLVDATAAMNLDPRGKAFSAANIAPTPVPSGAATGQ
jgi:membrane peptidoglycan carboxypeptidase